MTLNEILEKREVAVLLIFCLLTTALVLLMMDTNSITPDETNYILLGKGLLSSEYPYSYTIRPPLMPSLISVLLAMGIDIVAIRILIPIIFMNLALLATYLFTKKVFGRKEAFIATLFLFTFPFFWRWGLSVLVDIPLITFSMLFLMFLYLGVEKERYLYPSAVFLLLALLLKSTSVLLIAPAFLYILFRKRWGIFLKKEFLISIAFVALAFALVFMAFNVLTSAAIGVDTASLFGGVGNISDVFKLILAPSLLFTLAGILWARGRKELFPLLIILAFIIILLLSAGFSLKLRQWTPVYPLFGVFAAIGYMKIRNRVNAKKAVDAILIILLVLSFVNTVYLVDLEEETLWGADEISLYVNSLGGVRVASEYLPEYLMVSTRMEIVSVPRYIDFADRTLEKDVFHSVLNNESHPDYPEYSKLWDAKRNRSYNFFDYGWLKENQVDYVILSIYNEFERSPVAEYYYPMFGPLEVPLIKRPYSSQRVPRDYEFQSDLFGVVEADSRLQMVKEIQREGQVIFKVYQVL